MNNKSDIYRKAKYFFIKKFKRKEIDSRPRKPIISPTIYASKDNF
jgi:hypothetical protein